MWLVGCCLQGSEGVRRTGLRFGGLESVVGKSAERDLRIRGQQTTRKYLVTFNSILSGFSASQDTYFFTRRS